MKNLNSKMFAQALTVILMVISICLSDLKAQFQIRDYDLKCGVTSGADFGRSIINRIDSAYAIAGYSYASGCGIGPFDWMLLRIKPSGNHESVRLIGTLADDKCYSVVQSRIDSGYFMSGYMYDLSKGKTKATIVKMKKNGTTLQYARWINDSLNSSYNQDIIDPANVVANAGWNERKIGTKQPRKILASQYSPAGVLNWAYRYDSWSTATTVSKSTDEATSLCFQQVGSCYGVAVKTNFYSGSANNYDIMIVKLNYGGSVIWKKVYRFNLPSSNYYPSTVPTKIIPMTDGGFVVVGTTNAYVQNETDIIVLRVNSAGGIVWSYTYGNTNFLESGNSIILDGNTLVITGARKRSITTPDALLMKISIAGGAASWIRLWDPSNPSETGFDLVRSNVSASNGYAITGDCSFNSTNPFLWRTNTNGIVSGGDCNDSTNIEYRTNPHKLDSFALQRVKVLCKEFTPSIAIPSIVTKTECMGTAAMSNGTETDDPTFIDEEVNEVTEYALNQNYPNPFNPSTIIEFALPNDGNVSIKIYDITGKEVYTLVNAFKPKGIHKAEFNAGSLSNGVYYYKITSGNFTDVKKMILLK